MIYNKIKSLLNYFIKTSGIIFLLIILVFFFLGSSSTSLRKELLTDTGIDNVKRFLELKSD